MLRLEVPKEKLVLGLATYGRSFTLSDPSDTSLGAEAGYGEAGEMTAEPGLLGLYEVGRNFHLSNIEFSYSFFSFFNLSINFMTYLSIIGFIRIKFK